MLLPQEQLLNHVATPNDLAQCLQAFCSTDVDSTMLEATQVWLHARGHLKAFSGWPTAYRMAPSH